MFVVVCVSSIREKPTRHSGARESVATRDARIASFCKMSQPAIICKVRYTAKNVICDLLIKCIRRRSEVPPGARSLLPLRHCVIDCETMLPTTGAASRTTSPRCLDSRLPPSRTRLYESENGSREIMMRKRLQRRQLQKAKG